MKNIVIAAFLVLTFLSLVSCDSSNGPNYDESFFPLKEGNTWFYAAFVHFPDSNDGIKRNKWEVTGSKLINGKMHIEVTEENLVAEYPIKKKYYYLDGDKLYIYNEERDEDGLFADFSLEKDQTFDYFDYKVKVTEKNANVITFFYDIPQYADEEHWIGFERGIGIKWHKSVWGIGSVLIDSKL